MFKWFCTIFSLGASVWRTARRSFALLQKSRRSHRSYVWTEALWSGMVFAPAQKLSGSIVWTPVYPICDSSLSRSARHSFAPRRNHRSYMWTEALCGMIFAPAQKLSGIVWTTAKVWYKAFSPIYANLLELTKVWYKEKRVNSYRIGLEPQHVQHLEQQHGRRDFMWKRSVASSAIVSSMWNVNIFSTYTFFLFYSWTNDNRDVSAL